MPYTKSAAIKDAKSLEKAINTQGDQKHTDKEIDDKTIKFASNLVKGFAGKGAQAMFNKLAENSTMRGLLAKGIKQMMGGNQPPGASDEKSAPKGAQAGPGGGNKKEDDMNSILKMILKIIKAILAMLGIKLGDDKSASMKMGPMAQSSPTSSGAQKSGPEQPQRAQIESLEKAAELTQVGQTRPGQSALEQPQRGQVESGGKAVDLTQAGQIQPGQSAPEQPQRGQGSSPTPLATSPNPSSSRADQDEVSEHINMDAIHAATKAHKDGTEALADASLNPSSPDAQVEKPGEAEVEVEVDKSHRLGS